MALLGLHLGQRLRVERMPQMSRKKVSYEDWAGAKYAAKTDGPLKISENWTALRHKKKANDAYIAITWKSNDTLRTSKSTDVRPSNAAGTQSKLRTNRETAREDCQKHCTPRGVKGWTEPSQLRAHEVAVDGIWYEVSSKD